MKFPYPCMLIAYDNSGNIVATLDYLVQYDAEGNAIGLVDFATNEFLQLEHTDVWTVSGAKGSKIWPEWLGERTNEFLVELDGPPGQRFISTLVHKASGVRRERAQIEERLAQRFRYGGIVNVSDIVGGPDKPLRIDAEGRTIEREATSNKTPLIGIARN